VKKNIASISIENLQTTRDDACVSLGPSYQLLSIETISEYDSINYELYQLGLLQKVIVSHSLKLNLLE
jgi:hypothetical protein